MVDYCDEIKIGTGMDGDPIYIRVEEITTTTEIHGDNTHVTIHATLL